MRLDDIKTRRKDLGLTQANLAHHAGLSIPLIQLLERGEGNPSLETIERLGQVLGFIVRLEPKPADWSVLVKAGVPLSGIPESPDTLTILDVVREFRLAWKQAQEERDLLALKALLLALKSHYPTFYKTWFEAHGIELDWADVDGRMLKLSRMARAKIRFI